MSPEQTNLLSLQRLQTSAHGGGERLACIAQDQCPLPDKTSRQLILPIMNISEKRAAKFVVKRDNLCYDTRSMKSLAGASPEILSIDINLTRKELV